MRHLAKDALSSMKVSISTPAPESLPKTIGVVSDYADMGASSVLARATPGASWWAHRLSDQAARRWSGIASGDDATRGARAARGAGSAAALPTRPLPRGARAALRMATRDHPTSTDGLEHADRKGRLGGPQGTLRARDARGSADGTTEARVPTRDLHASSAPMPRRTAPFLPALLRDGPDRCHSSAHPCTPERIVCT
jgi:hypothetical protein